MKRLIFAVGLVVSLFPAGVRAAPTCDAGAFEMAACFPSLSAPVLAWPGGPGGLGIPRVISWASTTGNSGIAWGATSAITGANASWTYTGTDLVGNVPTGKNGAFGENGTVFLEFLGPSQMGTAGETGLFTANGANISIGDGAAKDIIANPGTASGALVTGARGIAFRTGGTPLATDYGISEDSSNIVTNAPTGKGFSWTLNGSATPLMGMIAQDFTINSTGHVLWDLGTGKLIRVRAAGNTWFTISRGGGLRAPAFTSDESDASGAVVSTIDNTTALTTAGAKLLSLRNAGSEKAFIDYQGSSTWGGAATFTGNGATGSGGSSWVGQSSNVTFINASSGNQIALSINNIAQARVSGVRANPTDGSGQLEIAHLAGSSAIPTSATAGTGCGTSSSPSVTANSSDLAGSLHVVCGSGGTTTNLIVSATWGGAYNSVPKCQWTPLTAATAAVWVSAQIIDGSTTAAVGVKCGGGTCPTATLDLGYQCIQ